MNITYRGITCVVAGLLVLAIGCQPPSAFDDLDTLVEDANGNGFLDVMPPPGVVFDTSTNVKVRISSTLVPTDLVPHAEEAGVDPSLATLAVFFVEFSFTLGYADGTTVVLRETEPFAPFEFAFEVACPVSAELTVEVIATVPLTLTPITRIPVGLSLAGVDFGCGNTIEFATFVNENGEVVETIDVF